MLNLSNLKATLGLWTFSFLKIPVIFFVRPSVIRMSDKECVIKIPLNRRTRNHLNSMYFGVLAVGADCAGGLLAMEAIRKSGKKVSLVFKDFRADFLRRPESDVLFACRDGLMVRKQVQEAIRTGKRINRTVTVIATAPKSFGDAPVVKFKLTLSLKAK